MEAGQAVERLLEPIRLGTVEIPNRVVRTAHGTRLYGADRLINDDIIEYHATAARGGAGLTILEIGSVHPSSMGGQAVWNEAMVERYRALMARLAPFGTRVFAQLWHGGAQAPPGPPAPDGPPWSASPVQPNPLGQQPISVNHEQIATIVAAFADAGDRVVRGGLDGLELHFAHGYLVHQFLSPLTNLRTDEYGGDLGGRMRFALEILGAVRDRVGPDFPVGARISPETVPGGTSVEEAIAIVHALEATGRLDFVDVSIGSYFRQEKFIGGMYEPAGYMLPTSLPIARATSLPAIVTGRITTLAEAEALVAAGDADLVGMTRAHIADPAVMAKTLAGRTAEVRPCIACDMCVASMYAGGIRCAVNPGAGRERTRGDHRLEPAAPRRVVVVGGGPAGLEASRVAAARGHRVTLLEAAGAVGGQLARAARAPSRTRLQALVDWWARELQRLGVDVRTGTEATGDAVAALEPDCAIVASGVLPRLDGVQTISPGEPLTCRDGAVLTSSWDVLEGALDDRRTVAIVDDTGHFEPVAAAEHLLLAGAAVTYVTTQDALLPKLQTAFESGPALHRLRTSGRFAMVPRALGLAYDGATLTVRDIDGGDPWDAAAEAVVFVSANYPDPTLADALRGQVADVHVVGDALSQRHLRAAIEDGSRVGATI
jgi:2,4-dienoyl-CoA reductase-like NADH-dependent reductase (Old Yellow Enzyme family)